MVVLTIVFSMLLSVILLVVYFLVGYIEYSGLSEKATPFECGFDPLSDGRTPFSTRFFLLVVLFLIFDVEVALLFPMLSMLSTGQSSLIAGGALAVFLLILLLGTFHEWNEGALDWMSG